MGKLQLIIYCGKTGWDISDLVMSVTWSGRKGAAPRTLEVEMIDDDAGGQGRKRIDVEKGYTCQFLWNGKEKFRGIIMKVTESEKKVSKWKAYDESIYLSNSSDSFSYHNKTAAYIFKDCINRAGLKVGKVAKITSKISSLQKPKASYYDAILDSLSTTYKKTKHRYYVRADKGKVDLLRRKEETTQIVLEVGENITNYTYSKSIENIKTRFRIYSSSGKVVYEKKNAKLEKKLGRFVMVESTKDKYNDAQVRKLVNTMIEENGHPEESLTITTLGIVSAIAGGCVYVIIPHLDIKRTFYIDEDKHVFKGENHMMTLKLNFATDIGATG